MFEYLELDPNDNPGTQGTGSLPLSPETASQGKGIRFLPRALTPEKVRHMLYGSLAGIDRTIKILHAIGYADPNDGRDPIPVPPSAEGATTTAAQWMVIMTKTVLLE